MAHNYRDLLLDLTVKNKDGVTFNDVSSLDFDFKVDYFFLGERRELINT